MASVLARFTLEDEVVVEPELQNVHVTGYMPHFKLRARSATRAGTAHNPGRNENAIKPDFVPVACP